VQKKRLENTEHLPEQAARTFSGGLGWYNRIRIHLSRAIWFPVEILMMDVSDVSGDPDVFKTDQ
jgi:hypothetical protein